MISDNREFSTKMNTQSAAMLIVASMFVASVSIGFGWYYSSPFYGALFMGVGVFFTLLSIACLVRFHFELLRKYYDSINL